MEQNANQDAVLQAILELSNQLKTTKDELQQQIADTKAELQQQIQTTKEQIVSVENTLSTKIDKINTKLHILSDELLETRADVRTLQKAR
ncbi:hypothetical protein [Lysinibacillus sp. 54212]|uniref:hypothetical protein n=1 Tax=Lysinibacillus sp. 54212 TaxID=3119829 RepID=UPI002FCB79B2